MAAAYALLLERLEPTKHAGAPPRAPWWRRSWPTSSASRWPVRSATLLSVDLAEQVGQRVRERSGMLAALLASDDERLAAATARDVLGALWPHGVADGHWWRTPLRTACARWLSSGDESSVTHQAAALMLGVSRGTVAQLVHRGTLTRPPGGGVSRASVLARLSR